MNSCSKAMKAGSLLMAVISSGHWSPTWRWMATQPVLARARSISRGGAHNTILIRSRSDRLHCSRQRIPKVSAANK